MKVFVKLVLLIIVFTLILLVGFIGVMKTKKPLYYSINKKEAINNNTYISEYNLITESGKFISEGTLVYALKKNIIFSKIQLNNRQLSIKIPHSFEEKYNLNKNNTYWEAFFKEKKLTAFEDKGIIGIIGVDKNMDTIKLIPNKEEIFYVVPVE